jgi:predicted nucleotidyltransferase
MVAQGQTSLNLSSREKTAVRDFLTTVCTTYGEKIQYSALFGSRVRGDSQIDSDIDILLIVTNDHWRFQQAISKISSEVALKYDVTLDVRIISKSRWQYYADIQAGLYQNISKEAVPFKVRIKRTVPAISKAG